MKKPPEDRDGPEPDENDVARVRSAMLGELTNRPPTIGVVGVSGVGKSSTLNVLFKTQLKTSPTVACTKEFWTIDLEANLHSGVGEGLRTQLRVVDAPGLGEDEERDPRYLKMYAKHLPSCDVVLWVLAARNRAVALDQLYLRRLRAHHHKIVFGLNQVDLVEPRDWDRRLNLPSSLQERRIQEIAHDRSRTLGKVLRGKVAMIPYSVETGYNLEELFHFLISAAPLSRRWIFGALKNFSYSDFVPKDLRYLVSHRKSE